MNQSVYPTVSEKIFRLVLAIILLISGTCLVGIAFLG